jgi:hypothetical protein
VKERFIGAGCHAAGSGREYADEQTVKNNPTATARPRHFFIPEGTAHYSHNLPRRRKQRSGKRRARGAKREAQSTKLKAETLLTRIARIFTNYS